MAKGDPAQIDPLEAIRLQQGTLYNQQTPFGNLTYQHDQGGPRNDNRVTVSLSPEQQAILEQQQLGALLSGQIGTEQLGRFGEGGYDANRQRVEQSFFDRGLSLINPELDRREGALRQRLANQGLPQASGAFNREVGRFETGRNQTLENLADQAVLAGGAEESRLLSQIMAILGRGQPIMPQFQANPNITIPFPEPSAGADPLSLIFGLGGAGLGAAYGGPMGAAAGYQIGTGSSRAFQGR